MGIPVPPDLDGALSHVTESIAQATSLAIRDAAAIYHVEEDALRLAINANRNRELLDRHRSLVVPCRCATAQSTDPLAVVWINGGCVNHPPTGTVAPIDRTTT